MYGIADMEGMLNGLEEEVEKWRVNGGRKSGNDGIIEASGSDHGNDMT